MKKIILFSILFLVPFFAQANDNISWSDFNQSCFLKTADIKSVEKGVIKVEIKSANDLFFVQDNNFLANKIFDYGAEKYLDYKVVSTKGINEAALKYEKYLNDGNLETSFNFDPYSDEEKEIIIDMGEIQDANSILFKFNYQGSFTPFYYVSKDGLRYIGVKNVQSNDFRFLKITFRNLTGTVIDKGLSIQELGFLKLEYSTYLVKTNSTSPVKIYADYKCEDVKRIIQAKNLLNNISRQTVFSINANTKKYSLSYDLNPYYNFDIDNDSFDYDYDNCPFVYNMDQNDQDGDLLGDACDLDNIVKNFNEKDSDNDGVGDAGDNCPYIYNPLQADSNADKRGDLCSDDDGDGVVGSKDNCISISNPNQADININSIGDACEFDKDQDGIFDSIDNCMTAPNPDQQDKDNDNIGDICDNCDLYNPRQIDKDNNSVGDECDEQTTFKNDNDKDGVLNNIDNCISIENLSQVDTDMDGVGDACDNCSALQNADQKDENKNGVGDICEDEDGDSVIGYLDNCINIANPDQFDKDNDGIGDMCEDDDGDGVLFANDNCPHDYNQDQSDIDKDKVGDKCDKKDDRFIESNPILFYGFIIIITIIFAGLIIFMIKKIKNQENNLDNN